MEKLMNMPYFSVWTEIPRPLVSEYVYCEERCLHLYFSYKLFEHFGFLLTELCSNLVRCRRNLQ